MSGQVRSGQVRSGQVNLTAFVLRRDLIAGRPYHTQNRENTQSRAPGAEPPLRKLLELDAAAAVEVDESEGHGEVLLAEVRVIR